MDCAIYTNNLSEQVPTQWSINNRGNPDLVQYTVRGVSNVSFLGEQFERIVFSVFPEVLDGKTLACGTVIGGGSLFAEQFPLVVFRKFNEK